MTEATTDKHHSPEYIHTSTLICEQTLLSKWRGTEPLTKGLCDVLQTHFTALLSRPLLRLLYTRDRKNPEGKSKFLSLEVSDPKLVRMVTRCVRTGALAQTSRLLYIETCGPLWFRYCRVGDLSRGSSLYQVSK